MQYARLQQLKTLRHGVLDVLVIGGGINGAGTLRDLALRAEQAKTTLRLALIEQEHFASGTSGKNSQLIHGGLRYLKYFEFALVRESLRERSTLLRMAPDFVHPLPFLLPMYGWKSRILYGTGLSLYDVLSGSHSIAQHRILSAPEVAALEPGMSRAGLTASAVFYDCGVHSARLVLANIIDAMDRGALAANYVQSASRNRRSDCWEITVRDRLSGEMFAIKARKIIDATGAWSDGASLRLVRGSHIVIPRVNESDHAVAYFDHSGRIVFLIPWGSQKQLTLVGTTDVDHVTGPDDVRITAAETDYLLGVVGQVFPKHSGAEVISSYSSLRPLVSDGSDSPTSASRGHRIWDTDDGILHIAGGKYTTYRAMSEEAANLACQEIAPALQGTKWTESIPLAAPDEAREIDLEQHLSDHLFISTYLGYERRWDAESLRPEAQRMAGRLGWDEPRIRREIESITGSAFTPALHA